MGAPAKLNAERVDGLDLTEFTHSRSSVEAGILK
jgi:hypothetical protein